jgi:hypothetical protein
VKEGEQTKDFTPKSQDGSEIPTVVAISKAEDGVAGQDADDSAAPDMIILTDDAMTGNPPAAGEISQTDDGVTDEGDRPVPASQTDDGVTGLYNVGCPSFH